MKCVFVALTLTLAGVASAQMLTARVKPAPKESEKKKTPKFDPAMKAKVDALVVKLGDKSFKVRKQAKKDLKKLGDVEQYLKPHLKHDDVEVRENVKEVLAKLDPYPGLEPSRTEPEFWRKRALKNGEKPKTVGEKLWLDRHLKGTIGSDGTSTAQLDAAMAAMAQERAKKRAAEEKAKAVAEKTMLEEKAKAVVEKKMLEEKAKAVAAMKAAVEAAKKAEMEKRDAAK